MNTPLREITESEFRESTATVLFGNDRTDRKFALLTAGYQFKLAWQSDSLAPTVKEIKPGIWSVGIDQNFAIVNDSKKLPLLKIDLDYPYCSTEIFKDHLFVTSQLEIIKVDMAGWTIVQKYDLPEYFESMKPKGSGYEVTCMDDITVEIV